MKQLNSALQVEAWSADTVNVVLKPTADMQFTVPNESAVLIQADNFADGRVFSIARILRDLGYTGRITIEGIGADQSALAFGVGADAVVISDGENAQDWQRAAGFISAHYGARAPQSRTDNIIDLRHGDH